MRTLLCLVAAAPLIALAEPLTFKGHELGAERAAFLAAFPGGQCKGEPKFGDACAWFPSRGCSPDIREQFCFKQFNYGGVLPTFMTAEFYRERLVRVSLYYPVSGFRQLRAAMVERFGEPTDSKQEAMQNRMGATFESERLAWIRDDAILTLRQRASKVDEGAMNLTSRAWLQEMQKQDKSEAKSRAKDL